MVTSSCGTAARPKALAQPFVEGPPLRAPAAGREGGPWTSAALPSPSGNPYYNHFSGKGFCASGTTKIDRNLDGLLTLINETLSRTVAPVMRFLGLLV
jgi:hypothetical protein